MTMPAETSRETIAAAATPPSVGQVLRDVLSLTKPRITMLVAFTSFGGMWVAERATGIAIARSTSAWALIGTCLVVSGASAFNMFLERDTDALMDRTRARPLPSGRMAPSVALGVAIALSITSVPLLFALVNAATGILAAFALVTYAFVYTPLKRRTPWALPIGAVPGAIPPLLGWTAVTGRIDPAGLVLFGILFFWQLPHSLAIATFRREDYRRAGTQVLTVTHGKKAVRLHIVVESFGLVAVSALLVPLGVASHAYLAWALVLGALLFGFAAAGLRSSAGDRWARGLFGASILYLALLMVALVIGT